MLLSIKWAMAEPIFKYYLLFYFTNFLSTNVTELRIKILETFLI